MVSTFVIEGWDELSDPEKMAITDFMRGCFLKSKSRLVLTNPEKRDALNEFEAEVLSNFSIADLGENTKANPKSISAKSISAKKFLARLSSSGVSSCEQCQLIRDAKKRKKCIDTYC